MKKGPLSNKEKQFIADNPSMQPEDIATELGRSLKVIAKYVEIKSPEKESAAHELFARKADRGVTVMTEAASMAGDESKSNRTTSSPKRYEGAIHKIKED
tara:strand:+ start:16 stop:315 length:300 start_codon:yes stop_codon:yes gene_type:complete